MGAAVVLYSKERTSLLRFCCQRVRMIKSIVNNEKDLEWYSFALRYFLTSEIKHWWNHFIRKMAIT